MKLMKFVYKKDQGRKEERVHMNKKNTRKILR